MSTEATIVFVAVVAGRFVLPLFIPRFPLPAIIACLVLDGVDQTIFQSFGFDPPGYQNYDKAMDVYYLAIAFITTMRNWTAPSAVQVARFLFFYRMAGVALFEFTGWRPLLLLFPNTFEYFFIAYEIIRLRWEPSQFGRKFWIGVAAVLWVVVKLPQEYWIHVAKLDVTDTLAEHVWAGPLLVAVLLGAAAAFWFVLMPRLPATDHTWRVRADPLPEDMDTAAERDAWTAANMRIWSWTTLEKVVLIGLLSVIYGRILPDLRVNDVELFIGIGVYIVLNAIITLAVARRSGSREHAAVAFLSRVLVNIGLVTAAQVVFGESALDEGDTLFFVLLVSLLVTFHDRYVPVGVVRAHHHEDRRLRARPS